MTFFPHTHPLPPLRLPRVLPTPPRPAPAPSREGLQRIVYDEVLFALLKSGHDELGAVAIALSVSRKVAARAR